MGPFHMSYEILLKSSPTSQIKACRQEVMLLVNQNSLSFKEDKKITFEEPLSSTGLQICVPDPWL
jgi:hypothetical protein